MKYYYIGAFPIEGGGVTIKNRDLHIALSSMGLDIKKVDLNVISRYRSIREFFKLLLAFINPCSTLIIGISTGKSTRRSFTKLLYYFNRRVMRKSLIFVMGGTESSTIVKDKSYQKWMKQYKRIYLETPNMVAELKQVGLNNVSLYPNPRFRPHVRYEITANKKLKCVFFSYINRMKGIDIVIDAAKCLPNVDFSIYGDIEKGFEDDFYSMVRESRNINYKGNFSGTSSAVYDELSKYDILLFPTRYETEGVPGVLVEAKIAGLAIIVSNNSHNSEIVSDGINGIVLKNNTYRCLYDSIMDLNLDRDKLYQYRVNSQRSSEDFFIENYIEEIYNELQD